MQNAQLKTKPTSVDTPMRKLIKCMPEMAYAAFDRCQTNIGFINKYNQFISEKEFDFELLEDHCAVGQWYRGEAFTDPDNGLDPCDASWTDYLYRRSRFQFVCDKLSHSFGNPPKFSYSDDAHVLVKNHVLSVMAKHSATIDMKDEHAVKLQTRLLRHPLCRELIRKKWRHFGLPIFATFLTAYLLYLSLFTWAALRNREPYYFYNGTGVKFVNDSQCEEVARLITDRKHNMKDSPDWGLKTPTDRTLKYLIYVLLWAHVVKGILLIFRVYRWRLMFRFYVEVVALVLSFVFLFDNEPWQVNVQLRCFSQWQVGAFGLFLGWSTLLVYIRFLPAIGLTVVMLEVIVRRFLWVLPVFLALICSFAFSFYMLLQNQFSFGTIGLSWLRTGNRVIKKSRNFLVFSFYVT